MVCQVGDQKGEGIGEGVIGQQVGEIDVEECCIEWELDEIVGRNDYEGYQVYIGQGMFVYQYFFILGDVISWRNDNVIWGIGMVLFMIKGLDVGYLSFCQNF